MNTTEHLVELYYRFKDKSFTYVDHKIKGGNNRQIDVLAYSRKTDEIRHIEVHVTHNEKWTKNLEELKELTGYKFFGKPKKSDKPNSDFKKGKTYLDAINLAYEQFGFPSEKIIRVWCVWTYPNDKSILLKWKQDMVDEFGHRVENFEILSMRDEVLPLLSKKIGSSNYDDDLLRVFSLLKVRSKQIAKQKK